MLYRFLIRPLLYLMGAETAHLLIIKALKLAQLLPGGLALMKLLFGTRQHPVSAMGLTFPSPVGLAAGFDKDAEVYPALGALGFGFVEVGTITAEAQAGNPKPRIFRLPRDRALINRMGFNNRGAHRAALHLSRQKRGLGPLLGINIGKTKSTPTDRAVLDYETSAKLLCPYADYFVVNVSSPNTPGLRDLQAVDNLRPILVAVRRALSDVVTERHIPLLVKIAPDLDDDDVRAVARLALELNLDGIIATNTTISREGLLTPPNAVEPLGAGGLSGTPLKERALAVLRLLHAETQGRLTLIAAGGIETAEDVRIRLEAGAQLVQVYTALVYEGPGLPSRLARALAAASNGALADGGPTNGDPTSASTTNAGPADGVLVDGSKPARARAGDRTGT